ncbi:hypothetical protein WN51_00095 [Melipona quadrifasciata]|uniref:Uncharacterized protein n=1 Tax=Melipona quadrifasciata TaxID=166423 RepID=A0A0N0BKW6_9HYME|nr:hypothetical protein WN51_00095 [Melipona quadrifasciata]
MALVKLNNSSKLEFAKLESMFRMSINFFLFLRKNPTMALKPRISSTVPLLLILRDTYDASKPKNIKIGLLAHREFNK